MVRFGGLWAPPSEPPKDQKLVLFLHCVLVPELAPCYITRQLTPLLCCDSGASGSGPVETPKAQKPVLFCNVRMCLALRTAESPNS